VTDSMLPVVMHSNYSSWSVDRLCHGLSAAIVCEEILFDWASTCQTLHLCAAGWHAEGLRTACLCRRLDRARWYNYTVLYLVIKLIPWWAFGSLWSALMEIVWIMYVNW